MPSAPTVSVLLPVYNSERYVREAIGSVLAQTFSDFELITVDDGSTDGSLQILREFAQRDARVRVISRPNTGIAGALNDAIAVARGEFLARMDADDISMPARFQLQVDFMRQHPDVVLLGSRVQLVEPYGSPVYETDHALDHETIDRDLLLGVGWAVVHPVAMMRTSAIQRAGGYRPDRVPIEDLDLFLRLTEIGRAANLPDILLHYRQHLQSANHMRFQEQEDKKLACVADAYARRGLTLPDQWRPPPRRQMVATVELSQWAWTAIKHRKPYAARRHAWSVVRLSPFTLSSWRLMFCAIRGW